ncbi:MAG: YggU family protein [Chloroflexi bacterium]|nr:YggU family protein [Chloroflexota bacterium]
MRSRKFHLHDGKKGAALAVRLTPKASRNTIVGVMDDGAVKIHLTAPPVDGKANEALIKFLSDVLGVAKSRIDIVAGATGRDKLISILDMDAKMVQQRIHEYLE